MKYFVRNGIWEGVSDECFVRCGIKKCTHDYHRKEYFDEADGIVKYIIPDGCIETVTVSVIDPYYTQAERYPNGHLVYIAATARFPADKISE